MRFSQSSFVYFDYSLQEAIRRLHRFGYQGVEVWGGRPHAYRGDLDGQLGGIRALLEECNMAVPNFVPAQFRYPSILCSCNETVREDSVGYIRHAIDNAVELGAPHVSVCPGKTLYGEDVRDGWQQLRRSLEELLEYAAEKGVALLIEPAHRFESNLILTVQDGLRMIEEMGSDQLGILLDTGHASVNGEDLAQAVLSLRGVPLHIHIDDNDGASDAHLVPGDGEIDFAPFVRALREIGYTGFVSAELSFGYTVDPDPAVERTLTWLRGAFAPQREEA
jgi:protein FrlC